MKFKSPYSTIIFFTVFILLLFSGVGLFYLLKFAFKSERAGSKQCIELKKYEMKIIQAAVVVLWFLIGFAILIGVLRIIYGTYGGREHKESFKVEPIEKKKISL